MTLGFLAAVAAGPAGAATATDKMHSAMHSVTSKAKCGPGMNARPRLHQQEDRQARQGLLP